MKRFLSSLTLQLLRFSPVEKAVAFVCWQRRRHLRRRAETRLRAQEGYPTEIQAGPFAGLRLPPHEWYFDARFEKTFGAYEPELFPLIETLTRRPDPYRTIINIGAADGFFTAGLAKLLPGTQVIGYEIEEPKRNTILEIARLNELEDRITLLGRCEPADLESLDIALPALVVVDVDGYEETLLVPSEIDLLRQVDLLIETHDWYVAGITETLKQRFTATHAITEIPMKGVDFSTIPPLSSLPMAEVDALVGSERPNLQSWLFLEAQVSTTNP